MNKLKIYELKTDKRFQFLDITSSVKQFLSEIDLNDGIVIISSPHTTAGITINENADPDVKTDMIAHLNKMVPVENYFKHMEGNSDAHIKTALIGTSVQIPFFNKKLILGTWQGIFFCEFDGPRNRKVHFSFIGN